MCWMLVGDKKFVVVWVMKLRLEGEGKERVVVDKFIGFKGEWKELKEVGFVFFYVSDVLKLRLKWICFECFIFMDFCLI